MATPAEEPAAEVPADTRPKRKAKPESTALVATQPRQMPLSLAAAELSLLCDMIDDEENPAEPTDAIIAIFQQCKMELAESVDRRIVFDNIVKAMVLAAKEARDFWAVRARRLEEAHEAFRRNIQEIIEARPDLPYEGRLGRFALQKNPPSVDYQFAINEVDDGIIEMFGVDERYVKTKIIKTIDTALVAADLKAGAEIPWAELKQDKKHVRIRASKMPNGGFL